MVFLGFLIFLFLVSGFWFLVSMVSIQGKGPVGG